ncbi:hypothetical protein B0H11DRAFT_2189088 [Mycena galericulata]|nr:hypothetical protein B0H11DRAFT_2189088 [Mycena galericulata]
MAGSSGFHTDGVRKEETEFDFLSRRVRFRVDYQLRVFFFFFDDMRSVLLMVFGVSERCTGRMRDLRNCPTAQEGIIHVFVEYRTHLQSTWDGFTPRESRWFDSTRRHEPVAGNIFLYLFVGLEIRIKREVKLEVSWPKNTELEREPLAVGAGSEGQLGLGPRTSASGVAERYNTVEIYSSSNPRCTDGLNAWAGTRECLQLRAISMIQRMDRLRFGESMCLRADFRSRSILNLGGATSESSDRQGGWNETPSAEYSWAWGGDPELVEFECAFATSVKLKIQARITDVPRGVYGDLARKLCVKTSVWNRHKIDKRKIGCKRHSLSAPLGFPHYSSSSSKPRPWAAHSGLVDLARQSESAFIDFKAIILNATIAFLTALSGKQISKKLLIDEEIIRTKSSQRTESPLLSLFGGAARGPLAQLLAQQSLLEELTAELPIDYAVVNPRCIQPEQVTVPNTLIELRLAGVHALVLFSDVDGTLSYEKIKEVERLLEMVRPYCEFDDKKKWGAPLPPEYQPPRARVPSPEAAAISPEDKQDEEEGDGDDDEEEDDWPEEEERHFMDQMIAVFAAVPPGGSART